MTRLIYLLYDFDEMDDRMEIVGCYASEGVAVRERDRLNAESRQRFVLACGEQRAVNETWNWGHAQIKGTIYLTPLIL